jgi:hypothetical protein
VFGYDPSTDIIMLKEPGTHGGVVNMRLYKAAQLQVCSGGVFISLCSPLFLLDCLATAWSPPPPPGLAHTPSPPPPPLPPPPSAHPHLSPPRWVVNMRLYKAAQLQVGNDGSWRFVAHGVCGGHLSAKPQHAACVLFPCLHPHAPPPKHH